MKRNVKRETGEVHPPQLEIPALDDNRDIEQMEAEIGSLKVEVEQLNQDKTRINFLYKELKRFADRVNCEATTVLGMENEELKKANAKLLQKVEMLEKFEQRGDGDTFGDICVNLFVADKKSRNLLGFWNLRENLHL